MNNLAWILNGHFNPGRWEKEVENPICQCVGHSKNGTSVLASS